VQIACAKAALTPKFIDNNFQIVYNYNMKKIYLAMAEMDDGNRIFERAYSTRQAAEKACDVMIKDIRENTDWNVAPIVEELELIDE
jgi:hypothetical protein